MKILNISKVINENQTIPMDVELLLFEINSYFRNEMTSLATTSQFRNHPKQSVNDQELNLSVDYLHTNDFEHGETLAAQLCKVT